MNNLINITKPDALQSSNSPIASSVNSVIQGADAPMSANSADDPGSFLSAFQKASDQLIPDEGISAKEVSGNNLPVDFPLSDVLPELSAENDHVLSTHILSTTDASDLNLSVVENDDLMLNAHPINAHPISVSDEPQSLSADMVLNEFSSTDDANLEQNSLSSLSLLSRVSEVATLQSHNDTASNITVGLEKGLNHVDSMNTVKSTPAPVSIPQPGVTPLKQDGLSPIAETPIVTEIDKIDRMPSNTVTTEQLAVVTKDTITNTIPGNIKEIVEEAVQTTLASDKVIPKVTQKGDTTTSIQQELIDSRPKQTIEGEIPVLQDDLSIDDVTLNTKQNLFGQKTVASLEQQIARSNHLATSLTNNQINHQEVVELNKQDLTISSIQTVSNQSDDHLSTAITLNGVSSQLRSMLQTKLNSKTPQSDNVAINFADNSAKIDRSLTQTMDVLSLSDEVSGLISDKFQNITSSLSQQQLVATAQASQIASFVPNAAKVVDTNVDSLLGISSTSITSPTSVNSFTLPQAEITEFFGRSTWPQAMGKQVLSMVNQNIGSAEIRLNPAHLGPIEILIDMSEDQVNVSLSSRHAVVREAMEQALPRLREMLDENGFNLNDADISKHSFAEQREQNTKNNDNTNDIAGTDVDHLVSSETIDSGLQRQVESLGTVDYFV